MDLLSTQAAQGRAFIDAFNTIAQDQAHDHVLNYRLYYTCMLLFVHIYQQNFKTLLLERDVARQCVTLNHFKTISSKR